MSLVDLFGEKLLAKEGEQDTTAVLKGKSLVMVFFSACWSPQSKTYTPILSEAYEKAAKELDKTAIIFVSSDRDQAAFDDYWGSMPFHALPYSARDLKDALSQKFGVKDIPSLVLLDGEGNLKEGNIFGRHDEFLIGPGMASYDPSADAITRLLTEGSPSDVEPTLMSPPTATKFVEMFGEKLLTQEGEEDTTEALAGKTRIFAVFGAGRDEQCHRYFAKIADAREKEHKRGNFTDIAIYVSLDRNQVEFDTFRLSLPFHAVPYSARDKRLRLVENFFANRTIPGWVEFDKEGQRAKTVRKQVLDNNVPSQVSSCGNAAETCINNCCIA